MSRKNASGVVGKFLVLLQDRFWRNVVSYFACDLPQYLSGS
jgi:hypothetical protein